MAWILIALWVISILATPVLWIVGWHKWIRAPRQWGIPCLFSLVSFATTSASALLVIGSLIYSRKIGGFPYYDPLLLRIYRWGAGIALLGFVLSLGGIWRRNTLRWYAPLFSFGVLLFWIMAAEGE
jgi:hypothetical protein